MKRSEEVATARWKHALGMAVAVMVAAVCYANAVELDFVFDDHAAVIRNADTNPASPLSKLLRNDFWGTDIRSPGSHRSYRPLTVFTFRLNRLWAEGVNNLTSVDPKTGETVYHHATQAIAHSFHGVNVALHAAVTAVLYALVAMVSAPGDAVAATVAATLFAAHPVHTEAVAGIVGRADLLCAILAMLAYLLYAHGARIDGTNWILVLCSVGLVVLSTLSKEVGLMILAPMAIHDVLLVVSPLHSLRARMQSWRPLCARVALLGLTGVGFLQFRKWLTVIFIVPDIRHIENPIAYTHGADRLFNLGMLHSKYMQLLFAPITLSADWSFNCLPLVNSFWDIRNLFSVTMYASAVAIAVLCLIYLDTGRRYLVPLSWLAAAFFPSSNVLFNVGTMVGERLLYVPSIGFCIAIGIAASSLIANEKRPRWLRYFVSAMCLTTTLWYSARTIRRNPDWQDDLRIYSTALQACPESAKAQMLVGQELQVQGHWKECIPYLQRALEIEPEFCETSYSLGVALYRTGSIMEGLRLIQRGVQCNFTTPAALLSLFGMYDDLMRLYPNEDIVLRGYAELLVKTGQRGNAASVYYVLGKRHWDLNGRANKEEGLKYVRLAIELDPEHCELLFWAGQMHAELGKLETAADLFEAASHKHNCSVTYAHALDKLIGVYQPLVEASPDKYQQRQINMLIRAQQAAQELGLVKQQQQH